ncbi:hypothetical protein BS78_05G271900 [Paspalum vaginatum]|nr:hypothetical protein BS78_05G271900 [Paspalum vaginatum]
MMHQQFEIKMVSFAMWFHRARLEKLYRQLLCPIHTKIIGDLIIEDLKSLEASIARRLMGLLQ